MGERKRRKEQLGDKFGVVVDEPVFLNFTRAQIKQAYDFTISGTWVCIGLLALLWIVVRVGAWQHWWGAR